MAKRLWIGKQGREREALDRPGRVQGIQAPDQLGERIKNSKNQIMIIDFHNSKFLSGLILLANHSGKANGKAKNINTITYHFSSKLT